LNGRAIRAIPTTVVKGHNLLARGDKLAQQAQRHDGAPMPIGQFIFFAVWLAAAMLGGAMLVFVWERLRARHAPPEQPGSNE